ncbi:MAG: YdgA family protein [Thiohalocapsa sp.]
MTRRAIAVVLAATVALALILPWFLGLRAEKLYRSSVERLSDAGYRILQDQYQRGWLQSKALLVIAPNAISGEEPPRLQIASRVAHGPLGNQLSRWPPVLAGARSRVTVIGGPRRLPPLHVRIAVAVGGSIAADLLLPDVTYSGAAGNLHLVDGRGELRVGVDQDHWSGSGELPLLQAVDLAGRALALKGLGWRFKLRSLNAGLPIGELVLTLNGLQLDAATDQPPLDVAGVTLRLQTAVDAAQVETDAEIRVDQFRINGADFAPSRLRMGLNGVDEPSLSALLDGLRSLDAGDLPETMRGLAIGALVTESLPDLIARSPRLVLDHLELTTPLGSVTASGHLALSGDDRTMAGQPTLWTQRLSGGVKVSGPQALVLQMLVREQRRRIQRELRHRGEPSEPIPESLEEEVVSAAQAALLSMIRDGWLVSDRGRLSAAAVIGDGLLTLNGKTFPIIGLTRP